MKRMRLFTVTGLMVFVLISAGAAAQKTAYIDLERAVSVMPDYNSAMNKLFAFRTGLQETYNKSVEEYRKKKDDYDKSSGTISNTVRAGRELELKLMAQFLEQLADQNQRRITLKQSELMAPVYTKAKDTIRAVATSLGYSTVIDISKTEVILYPATDNILRPVIEKLRGVKPN